MAMYTGSQVAEMMDSESDSDFSDIFDGKNLLNNNLLA